MNIYSGDVLRAVDFYRGIGFEETFRTPREGAPIHVELELAERRGQTSPSRAMRQRKI